MTRQLIIILVTLVEFYEAYIDVIETMRELRLGYNPVTWQRCSLAEELRSALHVGVLHGEYGCHERI